MWNEDGGTCSEIAYKNIPFYLSSKGYGLLVNSSGKVSYELCSEVVTRAQFSLPGEKLDFMVIGGGDGKSVLQNYTALTGRPALPPAWSFGLWLTTSFTTDYDEKNRPLLCGRHGPAEHPLARVPLRLLLDEGERVVQLHLGRGHVRRCPRHAPPDEGGAEPPHLRVDQPLHRPEVSRSARL